MKSAALIRQLTAFISVGALATLFDYTVFATLAYGFDINAIGAALIGYICGGGLSYLLTRHFVFQSSRRHHTALPRFFSVMMTGFMLTGLSMAMCVDGLHIAATPARIFTYALVLVFNYLAHRFFTFRP